MRILLSIDDTDNLDSVGTGKLAQIFSQRIVNYGWGETEFISRHQLFVHPDIPYTSHNSSMCFAASISADCLEKIIGYGQKFLREESAVGSDPGFCLAVIERLKDPEQLIQFGNKAKKMVLTKQEAYETANRMGIHLSEHGGTGGGVIGALAGIGLRLGGNDGLIKGKYFIGREGEALTAEEIISQTDIQVVMDEFGKELVGSERIVLGEKVKSVLLHGKNILLVGPAGTVHKNKGKWQTLPKIKLESTKHHIHPSP